VATEREAFEGWCLLELMGHRKLAGFVREATIAGGSFVRIDIPGREGPAVVATQFYSPGSIYAITPVTEDIARRFAERQQPEPVAEWELPRRLPPSPRLGDDDESGPVDLRAEEVCDHGVREADYCPTCDREAVPDQTGSQEE